MLRKCNKTLIRCSAVVCLLFMAFALIIFGLHLDSVTEFIDENAQKTLTRSSKKLIASLNNCGQDEAFAYIPSATACKWAQTEFLIVFGVPSVDNGGRRRRRNLQRSTCWTFPDIATKANDYNGSMLVLYAIARNPSHGFNYSKSLVLEAEHCHDVVLLPVHEGRVTTNKTIGGKGYWGTEAEIGMGRKTFFWFQLALREFPRAIHIGKCDDDMFMKVPQYLADLRLLPQRGTYWGPYALAHVLKDKQMELVDVNFMVGYCVALARDTAEAVVSYEPLRRIVALPYSKEREIDFRLLSVNGEDIMVGRALKESGYPAVFVAEKIGCRFHNTGEGPLSRNASEHSVVLHHLKEYEYHLYMSYFKEKSMNTQNTIIGKKSPTFYTVVCPIKEILF